MEFVYMFTGGTPDYKWVPKTEFFSTFGLSNAVGYLEGIRNRIRCERGRRAADFFSGLRHVFAELDGLGKLFRGEPGAENTALNAVAYGEEYLGRVNSTYRDVYGLLFDLYRHGLMHTGLIRTVRFRNGGGRLCFLKWGLESSKKNHLVVKRTSRNSYILWISVAQLREDAARSVDMYINDLKQRGQASRLFTRLRLGYFGTAVALREASTVATPSKPPPTHPKEIKPLKTKVYSAPGLAWVKEQVRTLI